MSSPTADAPQPRGGVLILAVFLVSYLVWSVLQILHGTNIGINSGFGFDGALYGAIAMDPAAVLMGTGVSSERAGRILPSLLVRLAVQATGASVTPAHIILGFQILNAVCLAIAMAVWIRLTGRLRPTTSSLLIATASVFLSFQVLRLSFYYPVLTDGPGLCLAVLFLDAYLRQSPARWLWFLLALFTWPGLYLFALPVLVLRRTGDEPGEARWPQAPTWIAAAAGAAMVLLSLVSMFVLHFGPNEAMNPINRPLLVVSLAVAALYVFTVARSVATVALPRLGRPRQVLALVDLRAIGLIALAFVVRRLVTHGFVIKRGLSPLLVLFDGSGSIFIRSVVEPAVFLLCHLIYFGPIVLLVALSFRRILERRSLGELCLISLATVFALNSESRHLLHVIPFLAFWWLELHRDREFGAGVTVFVVGLALAASKFWLPLPAMTDSDHLLDFPQQYFFMHLGPWMSHTMYLAHAVAWVVLGAMLVWLVRERPARG